nr:MAG TPA: hypothetical protein [Caudoviricetes sp.]
MCKFLCEYPSDNKIDSMEFKRIFTRYLIWLFIRLLMNFNSF